jgi:hypothetical protein
MSKAMSIEERTIEVPQIKPPAVPTTKEALNIPSNILEELLLKHLLATPRIDIIQLSKKMGIISRIIEELIQSLRQKAMIEIYQPEITQHNSQAIRKNVLYALSTKGSESAQHIAKIDTYLGPVPIPIEEYAEVVKQQDIQEAGNITRETLEMAMFDVSGAQQLITQLGPALNSGQVLLLYGDSGTGKSYISKKLSSAFKNTIFIPHAIYAEGNIIKLFSALHHKPYLNEDNSVPLQLIDHHDRRWLLCHRPNILVGGELTMEMLEVNQDSITKSLQAPLQMQANNGMLIVDDLGRQPMPVQTLLNRWIVPMETKEDHFALPNGQQITVPFKVTLVFSSNLSPHEIADPAFLRRLGYKIQFVSLTESDYRALWQETSLRMDITLDGDYFNKIRFLHREANFHYYPYLPRDILNICRDIITFEQLDSVITSSLLEQAWALYFAADDRG